MASNKKTFVLVGPHAGATIAVNGHQFEDGRYEFHGSDAEIAILTNIFAFYGAIPEEAAELAQLRAQAAQMAPATPAANTPAGNTPAPAEPAPAVGSTDPAAPAVDAGAEAKMTLAEAVAALDPDVDSHWTSNNLPGLDDLERLTGKKVSRQEVEAIAAGYTRAKARQAKQMM